MYNVYHSAIKSFTKIDPNKQWTVEEVVKFVGAGGIGLFNRFIFKTTSRSFQKLLIQVDIAVKTN